MMILENMEVQLGVEQILNPSIHSLYLLNPSVAPGGLEPIPARGGVTLDRSPVHRRANLKSKMQLCASKDIVCHLCFRLQFSPSSILFKLYRMILWKGGVRLLFVPSWFTSGKKKRALGK